MHKVFIGTMRSNENEFEECMNSLNSQKGITFEHFLIQNEREYEAHVKLYDEWEKRKSEFDAFIKVDADMVLKDDSVILRCIQELNDAMNDGFTSIQCPLFDGLLEDMIFGLNCYSTHVKFSIPASKIYCDRSTENNVTKVIRSNQETKFNLYPAGSHCSNPGDHQAFLWGYHRGSKNNTHAYSQLLKSYEKNPTLKKKFSIAGFKAGSESKKDLSYYDSVFLSVYEKYTKQC